MNFADLYRYADGLDDEWISVTKLTTRVKAYHPVVGDVVYWPVDLNPAVSIGHLKYKNDRTSPYEPSFPVAHVRYYKELDQGWRRLVCCKELMHVFDGSSERVDTRERFIRLLTELESPPMKGDVSDMYTSEREALWMAALALCPARKRKAILDEAGDSPVDVDEVASRLRVPPFFMRVILDSYYEKAFERLTGDTLP